MKHPKSYSYLNLENPLPIYKSAKSLVKSFHYQVSQSTHVATNHTDVASTLIPNSLTTWPKKHLHFQKIQNSTTYI